VKQASKVSGDIKAWNNSVFYIALCANAVVRATKTSVIDHFAIIDDERVHCRPATV